MSRTYSLVLALLFCAASQGSAESDQHHWTQAMEAKVGGRLVSAAYSGIAANHFCFGDLDADGDLDLVIATLDETGLWYFPNTGTASHPVFGTPTPHYAGMTVGSHYPECTCALADIDGDGDLDIFSTFRTGGGNFEMRFVENVGTPASPAWAAQVDNWQAISLPYVLRPVFADIDADGDLDLFLGVNSNVGRLLFYENRGTRVSPSFSTSTTLYDTGTLQYLNPTIGDLEGDGDLDLIVGTSYPAGAPPLVLIQNNGTAASPSWAVPSGDYGMPVIDFGAYPCLVDYDQDGDLDVFAFDGRLDAAHASPFVLYENAAGPGRQPQWLPSKPVTFTMSAGGSIPCALTDIDADGDLDMFFAQHCVQFYRNVGNPRNAQWDAPDPDYGGFHQSLDCRSMAFCDIDADGDQDLFLEQYTSDYSSSVDYYRNIGTPQQAVWASGVMNYGGLSIPNPNAALAFADINGDGDFDLFAGEGNYLGNYGAGGGTIDYFENIGTPTNAVWAPRVGNYAGIDVVSFAAPAFGDVDHDGDLDLVVGRGGRGAPHVLTFAENIGTPSSPIWGPAQDNYADLWAPWDSKPAFADLNGDGLDDLVVMGQGPELFLNDLQTLSLIPAIKTVIPGAVLDFQTDGAVPPIEYRFARNASGGSISTSGHYVAGPQTGGVDAIEARETTTGRIGRAYVNVISSADLSASGKAVVMAGRKPNDSLWPSTNNLAHFIYRTLLYRGFSKPNVQYLNPVTGQDADGNGLNDDIDAASSLANVRAALTAFAAGSPNLFVYLIDHGDAEDDGTQGFVRCNETDVLTAVELDVLLDDLQQNHGVTTVTVVVDCCQSGSFLREVSGAPAGTSRVVVTACDPRQPAFFSAQGLISFTNAFVTALYSGLTVGQAFDLAAGAMDRYQQPALDDDGDGVYDKDLDGAVADTVTVGASFIAGADRPQIGAISPNATLSGGATAATVWASDVSAVYPIERVWATIAAPNFIPDSQLDPSQPVQNLPRLTLNWNAGASRYEATTDTFTMLGAYAVNLYAEDIWDGVSYPKQTYINQTQSDERIAIVCGQGAYDANSPWAFSDALAQTVYETARARWIDDAHVFYLTTGAHSGVDGAPTQANLQAAIGAAAGIRQLTVYMIGKGEASTFDIDGDGAPGDSDDVTPAALDGWLDALQGAGTTRVVVILDFNQSGAWVAPLAPPAGKERVVLTSCSAAEESWCEEGGAISFTSWLFSRVFNGVNVRDAYNWAADAVMAITGDTQTPLLDDDGNGTGDWRDGPLALGTYIGAAFVTGAEAPAIGDYARNVVLISSSALLWASDVRAAAGIKGVFAYVVRPGSGPADDLMEKVDLAYNAATGRWEATYGGFDLGGANRVIYYAKDREDTLSEGYRTTFAPQGSGVKNWRMY